MGVYSIWAIEAVCLVGCATAAGYWGAFDPFCEKCKLWLKTDPRATVEFAHVPDDVMARVSAATSGSDLVRAVSGLTPSTAPKGFKPEADKTYTSLTYVMRCCQTCDETNLLSVKTRVEQKGREEETWICGNSTISHDEALEVATKAGKAT